MKVSIVIPNYNGKQLLEKNLPSVIKRSEGAEIIVVDDGSTDDSVAFLKSQYPKIKLIQQKKNKGFSSVVNTGVTAASGEIVMLLNTDAVPQGDFLAPLIKHFNDPIVFAVGCLDKSIEGVKTVLRGRGIGAFKRGFLVHERGEVDKKSTLWVNGGSGVFRKDIWQKLDGMDEIYDPFYWEDIDLSYRALKAGYRIVFEKNSIVEHRHEIGVIKKHYSPYQIKKIAYRNQCMFVWKNISDRTFLVQHLLWLPYHKFKALMRFDTAFFAGFMNALLQLPKILKARGLASSFWKKTDTEVLQPFYEEMA